jgi:hypothetical protein
MRFGSTLDGGKANGRDHSPSPTIEMGKARKREKAQAEEEGIALRDRVRQIEARGVPQLQRPNFKARRSLRLWT